MQHRAHPADVLSSALAARSAMAAWGVGKGARRGERGAGRGGSSLPDGRCLLALRRRWSFPPRSCSGAGKRCRQAAERGTSRGAWRWLGRTDGRHARREKKKEKEKEKGMGKGRRRTAQDGRRQRPCCWTNTCAQRPNAVGCTLQCTPGRYQ